MQKISVRKIYTVLVFLTIWVYFSLNSRYFNLPASHLLRWIFPFMLVFFSLLENRWKAPLPPSAFILFSLAVIPSILLSYYKGQAFVKYLSWIFIFYGSYIYFMNLKDVKEEKKNIQILAVVLLIYQILNFIFVAIGINYDTGRALGITTNANTLGVYATLAYWAAIYMIQKSRGKILKGFYIIVLMTTIFTSIASGSRTAFVVLVINILLTIIFRFRKSPFLILYIIVLGVITYFVLRWGVKSLNILALNRLLEEGGTSRDDLWNAAISLWREHKVAGVGYTVSNIYNPIEPGMAFHNSYISFLAECGICGVIGLGSWLLFFIRKIVKTIIGKRKNVSIEFLIGIIMACNLMIAAWSESFMFAVGSTEGFTFWFLIAWIIAYIKLLNRG